MFRGPFESHAAVKATFREVRTVQCSIGHLAPSTHPLNARTTPEYYDNKNAPTGFPHAP